MPKALPRLRMDLDFMPSPDPERPGLADTPDVTTNIAPPNMTTNATSPLPGREQANGSNDTLPGDDDES